MPEGLTPEAWLELGIAGAALFIILTVVVLMFQLQARNVDKLCNKIDEIVTSFAENNLKLNEVILTNDKDQKETLRMLSSISRSINDMHKRVIEMDAKLVAPQYNDISE